MAPGIDDPADELGIMVGDRGRRCVNAHEERAWHYVVWGQTTRVESPVLVSPPVRRELRLMLCLLPSLEVTMGRQVLVWVYTIEAYTRFYGADYLKTGK